MLPTALDFTDIACGFIDDPDTIANNLGVKGLGEPPLIPTARNDWEFLSQVPVADHNAMLDPTCADITGRVLEALAAHGLGRYHRAVRRAVEWLVRHQEADGSWYGRWGVAYIYGTCFACAAWPRAAKATAKLTSSAPAKMKTKLTPSNLKWILLLAALIIAICMLHSFALRIFLFLQIFYLFF